MGSLEGGRWNVECGVGRIFALASKEDVRRARCNLNEYAHQRINKAETEGRRAEG